MSERYYLSDVELVESEDFDEYLPVAARHTQNFVCELSEDNTQALVLVSTANHSGLLGDDRIDALPGVTVDVRLDTLHSSTLVKMDADLASRGFGGATAADRGRYRTVIMAAGLTHNPNFDERNFKVSG